MIEGLVQRKVSLLGYIKDGGCYIFQLDPIQPWQMPKFSGLRFTEGNCQHRHRRASYLVFGRPHICFYFDRLGSGTKLCYVLSSDDILVHDEIRSGEYHEGWIGGLAMEVRVCVMLRDMLGVFGFATVVCKCGR
jgi:hypothetical protein